MKIYILIGFVAVLLGGCTTYTSPGYGTRVYGDGYASGTYYSNGYDRDRYYNGGYYGGYYDSGYDARRYYGRDVHNNVTVVQERNATVSRKTSTRATSTTASQVNGGHSTRAVRPSSPPKPHAESNKAATGSHSTGKHSRSSKTDESKKQ